MIKPFVLAVRAVVSDEKGRCLLIRRSQQCEHFAGQWEWPGGKVDSGEDFATALIREVREETSLEVEIAGLVGATQFEMATVSVVQLCLETRVLAGRVCLSDEHEDFAWIPLAELTTWDLVESTRSLVRDSVARNKQL